MKVKYFLRGLGFGILITTLLLFVSVGKNKSTAMTDEQIVERAKELGMLTEEEVEDYRLGESIDNLKESLSATENTESNPQVSQDGESVLPSPSASEQNKDNSSQEPEKTQEVVENNDKTTDKVTNGKKTNSTTSSKNTKKNETIKVKIKAGLISKSIAQYLYQMKVVESATDFKQYLIDHKLTSKIIAGEYEIPVDATYDEIVKIIT